MRFVSLFTGIGGFDLAFERVGMTCAAQVEIDKHARAVLARHWPDTPRFTDVRTFGRESIDGAIDLVCGGFPCQDLSVAGKRAGLAGARSGLWHEFHRILDEFRPAWCVIENVPGLLSSHGGRDFAVLLQGLAQLRYRVAWRVLDARYFGVPQRRRRVVIVGHIGDGRAAEVLFEPESVQGHPPPRRQAQQAAARTAPAGPGETGWRFQRTDRYVADDERQRLKARDYKSARDLIASYRPIKHDQFAPDDDSHSLRARQPRDTDQIVAFQSSQSGIRTSDTLRRLTPLECERLQGFPDHWTAGQSDSHRYKQTGNAVAVPVFEWVGRRIMENR